MPESPQDAADGYRQRFEELAEWRGIVNTRLANIELIYQGFGLQLTQLRSVFEASMQRLHEDVCRSLERMSERYAATQEEVARMQVVHQQELLRVHMVQARWKGGISVLVAVLPLVYGVVGGVVVYWLTHK